MNSFEVQGEEGRVGRTAAAAPPVRRTSSAFGTPSIDSTVKRIDLNDRLVRHPDATFLTRARGDAMAGAGIADGDVLLVDRAIRPAHGSVVIAAVEGVLVCRRLDAPRGDRRGAARVRLVADPGVAPIVVTPEAPLEVWGVVTTVIKQLA